MPRFGRKKSPGKTVLVLDVENGSVGGALVHLSSQELPWLFAETRVFLPVLHSRSAHTLLSEVGAAAHNVLRHISEVAARLRAHPHTAHRGEVERAALFLSAPWGSPNLAVGKPQFAQPTVEMLDNLAEGFLGDTPIHFHSNAGALLQGSRRVLPQERRYLLCGISGEVSELLLVEDGRASGYATIPSGRHGVLRTLRSHGGLSEQEARSVMRLPTKTNAAHAYGEPLAAASAHFAGHFVEAARGLMGDTPTNRVYVVSEEPVGDWFARSLAESDQVGEMYPEGGVVRSLRAPQVTEHFSGHAEVPDISLMLQALFVDAGFSRYN